jgi:tetratricopeptide (TPR) repeat protein
MVTIPEALANAVQHLQAGELQIAEQIYRQILAVDPDQADALHLLGVIAFQMGKHEFAIKYISRAIDLDGTESAFHSNLGNAFKAQGKLDEAVASYRRALELRPDDAGAYNNLGSALQAQGKLDEAVESYRWALKLNPDHVEARGNLGNAFQNQGRLDEAIEAYRRALELNPDLPEAHYNLGNAYQEKGKLDEAVASYCQELKLKPAHAQAHNNLGIAYKYQGKLDEAVACFHRALELRPDEAEVYSNLGTALVEQGKLDKALDSYRRALELRPDYAIAHYNLGNALQAQGKLEQAVASYHQALELKPDDPVAQNNLGNVYQAQEKLDEAVACYRRALQLEPDYAEAYSNLGNAFRQLRRFDESLASYAQALRIKADCAEALFNRSLLRLLVGDFQRGWPEYEWRWKTGQLVERKFSQPLWDGNPLEGRTILLHAEQGFGDTIQFVRFAPLVKERGAAVILECQRGLLPLLEGVAVDRLVGEGQEIPSFDVHAPLLSLPGIFKTRLNTIPANIPYLFAKPPLVERWRARLQQIAGYQIGVAWQGSPGYRSDRDRSINLTHFTTLARIPGVRLISLQKGTGTNQLSDVRDLLPITDFRDELDDTNGPFMDTAAIMQSLDLVIAADTAVAHLAGALGVPVWLALSFVPHWPWLLDRTDSPWYPTMRLFRQKRPGDWAGVFDEIQSALRERLNS